MESSQVCQIQMKVRVCEDERTRWTREERSAPACSGRDAVLGRREGFRGQGESRPDWAATETLSAAWLPPKDSAPPPPPQASLLRLHSLLHFPLSSFCSFPPSPSACSLSPAPFLHFSHFFFFSSPHFSSGPLQTLSSRLRGGGGWLRRWDEEIEGHKSPEMQWSDESGWL